MKQVYLMTFALLLTFAPFGALAGHSTNGGVFTLDSDNVWFLGDAPIEYCVTNSPHFSFSRDELRAIASESLRAWKSFFEEYRLDKESFTGIPLHNQLRLSLSFREVETCNKPDEQLHFAFGTQTPLIKKALESQESALGLSVRGDYNHESFRNGGSVWFRATKYTEGELKHLVLHELGHVFGMEHDSVYVMDRHIADYLQSGGRYRSMLGLIESSAWPYRFEPGDLIDFTEGGREKYRYEPNFLLVFLREIIGFDRNNNHSVKLRYVSNEELTRAAVFKLSLLEFETGKSTEMSGTFSLRPLAGTQTVGFRGPVLYTRFQCDHCSSGAYHTRKYLDRVPAGLEAYGSFNLNGVVMPALLEQKKGAYLKVFVPQRNAWWTVENYVSTYFLND